MLSRPPANEIRYATALPDASVPDPVAGWLLFARVCRNAAIVFLAIIVPLLIVWAIRPDTGRHLTAICTGLAAICCALWLIVDDVARRAEPRRILGTVLLICLFGLLGVAVWLTVRPPLRSYPERNC